jgi:hypothetical protein
MQVVENGFGTYVMEYEQLVAVHPSLLFVEWSEEKWSSLNYCASTQRDGCVTSTAAAAQSSSETLCTTKYPTKYQPPPAPRGREDTCQPSVHLSVTWMPTNLPSLS